MKRKFDFVLDEDKGCYRDVFRFYPRGTHVHSHTDKPPKTWDAVYKVYYDWAIIRQHYKGDSDEIEPSETHTLMRMYCDECSSLPDLSAIIKYVIKTGNTYDYPTWGQPAGDWRIEKKIGIDLENEPYEDYLFWVFNNWTNVGFRFILTREETDRFCEWLDEINQYALDHGEGI